ncbi:hypothetical protein Cabys_2445 [Caldithrix abyssi DSM 13497]|uniref:Uncharacterized protein n=1 Tax=Caldithrix abyssi DSM 13497 TaxID=880073 RepID=A0A1J1CB26_CALAY|nr:hypothetical protein Cabys_2445 [Caldithrix abyssi DSM 13497]
MAENSPPFQRWENRSGRNAKETVSTVYNNVHRRKIIHC